MGIGKAINPYLIAVSLSPKEINFYKKLKINQEKLKKDNLAFKSEFEKLNKKAKIKSQKILNNNDKIIEQFNKDKIIRIKSQQDKINELRSQIMNDTTFNINKYDKKEIKKEITKNETELLNKRELLNININEIEIQNKIINTKSILINKKRLTEYLNKEEELTKINSETEKLKQNVEELSLKQINYKDYEYVTTCTINKK
jgi:hypothetical protein